MPPAFVLQPQERIPVKAVGISNFFFYTDTPPPAWHKGTAGRKPRKPPITAPPLETKWTMHPTFWLVWGLPEELVSVSSDSEH